MRPEFDGVLRVGVIVEVGFYAKVPNAGIVIETELVARRAVAVDVLVVAGYAKIEIAGNQRSICKKLLAEKVVPAQSRRRVTPVQPVFRFTERAFLVGVEAVAPEIPAKIDFVFLPKIVVDLGIQVIEIIARPDLGRFVGLLGSDERRGQHVDVSAPPRHQKRRFALDQRPFQRQAAGNQPDAALAAEFFLAAFFHIHVQHRRKPPAVLGRKAALGQFHTFKGVAVEDGEKAE